MKIINNNNKIHWKQNVRNSFINLTISSLFSKIFNHSFSLSFCFHHITLYLYVNITYVHDHIKLTTSNMPPKEDNIVATTHRRMTKMAAMVAAGVDIFFGHHRYSHHSLWPWELEEERLQKSLRYISLSFSIMFFLNLLYVRTTLVYA